MISKFEFKGLLANHIYELSLADDYAHIYILCYYLLDKATPITKVMDHFRRANVTVQMFPVYFDLPGFTNHVLALRPSRKYDLYSYDSISYCLDIVRSIFDEFRILILGGLFLRGHLVHVDLIKGFLEHLVFAQNYFRQQSFLAKVYPLVYFVYYIFIRISLGRLRCFFLNYPYWVTLSI